MGDGTFLKQFYLDIRISFDCSRRYFAANKTILSRMSG